MSRPHPWRPTVGTEAAYAVTFGATSAAANKADHRESRGFANLQLRVQCLSSQGRLPASRRVQAQPTVPLSFLSWRRVIADPNPVATVVFVPVLRVTHLCHESSRHHADGRSGGSGSIGANDIRRIIEIMLVDPARVLACRESCFDRRLRCLQRAMSRILQDKRAEESDLQRELSSGPTAHEI